MYADIQNSTYNVKWSKKNVNDAKTILILKFMTSKDLQCKSSLLKFKAKGRELVWINKFSESIFKVKFQTDNFKKITNGRKSDLRVL